MSLQAHKNLLSGMIVRTLFGYSVFNFVLLNLTLIAEFSLTAFGIGALMAAYWIPALIFPLLIGKLADKIGEKMLVVIGCFTIALGALIIGQAPYFEILLVGRFISGVGAILFWTSGINLVSKMYKNEKISFVTSLIVLCYGVGTLFAMWLVPVQGDVLGWRNVFMITAVYGLSVAITVLFLSKNPAADCDRKPCNVKKLVKNKNLFKIAIAQSFSVGAWTSFLTFFSVSLILEKGVETYLANSTVIIASISGIIFALIGGYLADKKFNRSFWIYFPLFLFSIVLFILNLVSGLNIILDLILSWLIGAFVWIPQGSIWSLPKIIEPKYPNIAMSILVIITAAGGILFPVIFGLLVDISATYLFSFIFLGLTVLFASILSYKID